MTGTREEEPGVRGDVWVIEFFEREEIELARKGRSGNPE